MALHVMTVYPPRLARWMPHEEKASTLVLFDFEPDLLRDVAGSVRLRFDLNVVFDAIAVRRGKSIPADYYIGTTGARIETIFPAAKAVRYTEGEDFRVEYTNTTQRSRESKFALRPSIQVKPVKADLAEVRLERGAAQTHKAVFQNGERSLAAICKINEVHWMLSMPRREAVVSDFLLGNLHLFVEWTWPGSAGSGTITARPSDLSLFDAKKREITSSLKRWMMLAHLWQRKYIVLNKHGVGVRWELRHDRG